MAASSFVTTQLTAEHMVESCGAVLFDLSRAPHSVCLIRQRERTEWVLPKGRRNAGETRAQAALREVAEETGYPCRLHPVTVMSRQPSAWDPADVPDLLFSHEASTEPIMLTVRHLNELQEVKLIWWFIAALDMQSESRQGEEQFVSEFFPVDEALQKLTFQTDRDVLSRAKSVLEGCPR